MLDCDFSRPKESIQIRLVYGVIPFLSIVEDFQVCSDGEGFPIIVILCLQINQRG